MLSFDKIDFSFLVANQLFFLCAIASDTLALF